MLHNKLFFRPEAQFHQRLVLGLGLAVELAMDLSGQLDEDFLGQFLDRINRRGGDGFRGWRRCGFSTTTHDVGFLEMKAAMLLQ